MKPLTTNDSKAVTGSTKITKHCPKCDAIPYPEDKFCFRCGKDLVYECESCHHIIQQKEFSFCPNCGSAAELDAAKKLRII